MGGACLMCVKYDSYWEVLVLYVSNMVLIGQWLFYVDEAVL